MQGRSADMYDSKEIERKVKEKRQVFWTKIIIVLFFMLVSLVISIMNFNDTATVLCVIAEFPLFFFIVKIYNKSEAKILLSCKIIGKNIKEYENGIQNDGQPPIFRWSNTPNTYANRKTHPIRLNGSVYLELDNGSVKEITGLNKSHTELFVEGDTLLKYAGTHFPIVISREMQKQPCPICGEVNDMSADACHNCGLGIIKTDKGE